MPPRVANLSRVAALAALAVIVTSGAERSAADRRIAADSLVPMARVDHVDALAREPMLVEHPSGALFVSGYGLPGPKLWKSADHGATWARVNVGTEAEGAIGNSDVDLAVARDGTLYFVQMGFDRSVGEGTHIAIGVSKDVGVTWRWTMIAKTRFDDRPWVAVAPDGTAHVIWNDGAGVCHAMSRDGGVTWTPMPRVSQHGGSSHLAIGPDGEVAVRIVPISASGHLFDAGVDLLAISVDGGRTWSESGAPGQREWAPIGSDSALVPRWVEPLAWDATGALYSLWTNRQGLWLARSADRARTWTISRLLEGGSLRYYPYLIAGANGDLVASWFSGASDSLEAHVAIITMRERSAPPTIVMAAPFQPDSWDLTSRKGDPKVRDPGGEYLAVARLHDGTIAVVSPIQVERESRYGFTWWTFAVR